MTALEAKCSTKQTSNSAWTLVSITNDVNNSLLGCKTESPTEFEEMRQHLESTPYIGIFETLTQMRLDTRVWEYKLPYDKRVLYVLNVEKREVIIGYAGQHLNKRCTDRKIRRLVKEC